MPCGDKYIYYIYYTIYVTGNQKYGEQKIEMKKDAMSSKNKIIQPEKMIKNVAI